jgi:hypothetical protein
VASLKTCALRQIVHRSEMIPTSDSDDASEEQRTRFSNGHRPKNDHNRTMGQAVTYSDCTSETQRSESFKEKATRSLYSEL